MLLITSMIGLLFNSFSETTKYGVCLPFIGSRIHWKQWRHHDGALADPDGRSQNSADYTTITWDLQNLKKVT